MQLPDSELLPGIVIEAVGELEHVLVVRELLAVSDGLPSAVFVEDPERLLDMVSVGDSVWLSVCVRVDDPVAVTVEKVAVPLGVNEEWPVGESE